MKYIFLFDPEHILRQTPTCKITAAKNDQYVKLLDGIKQQQWTKYLYPQGFSGIHCGGEANIHFHPYYVYLDPNPGVFVPDPNRISLFAQLMFGIFDCLVWK